MTGMIWRARRAVVLATLALLLPPASLNAQAPVPAEAHAAIQALPVPSLDQTDQRDLGTRTGLEDLKVCPLAEPGLLAPAGARDAVDLYVGLLSSGTQTWRWTAGAGEVAYWALDDGQMGAGAVGGGHVTQYEFAFGVHFDFPNNTLRPYVIVSFYNASLDPVAQAADPVVQPSLPVSSVAWIFAPITQPTAGFASYRSGLIDLAALGLDFDLDETFYVEILPLEWSSYPNGSPVIDPDIHAVFTGPGTVTYGVNQNRMWSDRWVRTPDCSSTVAGDGDGLYDHPSEMDTCSSITQPNQSGIVLRGFECNAANILALRIAGPELLCVQPGETVTITLSQACLPGLVRGYQAFLEFTPGALEFQSGTYLTPLPYGLPILTPIVAHDGQIDLAAGIDDLNGQSPTSTHADLVTLTFTAGALEGLTNVVFRAAEPPTRFSDEYGEPVVPTLVDTPILCVDGTPPVLAAPPPVNVQCAAQVPAPATDYAEFVAQGGVAIDDTCGASVVVTHVGDTDNGGAGCPSSPYVVTRTYRATDCAGNAADCVHTITVSDDAAPTATAPAGLTIECTANVPPAATTITEYLALPGAAAADNCTATNDLAVSSVDGPLTGGPCGGTITRRYTLRDACLNSVAVDQVITVNDTTPPVATSSGPIGPCYPTATAAEAAALAQSSATDNCAGALTPAAVTVGTCAATVTVTFADACGNLSNALSYSTRIDATPPVVTCPADLETPADAGLCTRVVTWPAATAVDECDGDVSGTVRYDIDLGYDGSFEVIGQTTTTYTFGVGTHQVVAQASDTCGNVGSGAFLVTVLGVNEWAISVELQPVFADGPVTRCISFEFWKCPATAPLATLDAELTFVNGQATAVLLTAPCGSYDCITARDKRHTLRRTATPAIVGTQYVASFTGNPATGGDWLIGGNLNDDKWIDILDYGIYAVEYMNHALPGADSACGLTGFHADINGDGLVTTGDFPFIQINFMKGHEANCCGQPGADEPSDAVTRISRAALTALGLAELAAGDLNGDDWLDVQDIAAFLSGVRPQARPAPAAPAQVRPLAPAPGTNR